MKSETKSVYKVESRESVDEVAVPLHTLAMLRRSLKKYGLNIHGCFN